ncbi:hypothetical protein Bca101_067668 [Brassica carinata]
MNPSLYPTEWWEYVMEYSKEITSLLNNSMFSPAPLIEDPISVTKVVFKTGEYKQQVIFIGGLTDGILATEYEASLFSLMSYLLSSPELLPPPLVTTTTGRLSLTLFLMMTFSHSRSLNLIFCCSCYSRKDCFIFQS